MSSGSIARPAAVFACDYEGCKKSFKTRYCLNRHTLIHENVRKYQCSVCQKKFLLAQYLKEHSFVHTGERPWVCSFAECNKSFRQAGKLSLHMKQRHSAEGKKSRAAKASTLKSSPKKEEATASGPMPHVTRGVASVPHTDEAATHSVSSYTPERTLPMPSFVDGKFPNGYPAFLPNMFSSMQRASPVPMMMQAGYMANGMLPIAMSTALSNLQQQFGSHPFSAFDSAKRIGSPTSQSSQVQKSKVIILHNVDGSPSLPSSSSASQPSVLVPLVPTNGNASVLPSNLLAASVPPPVSSSQITAPAPNTDVA
eukprot:GILK01009188.1.p1 GENE.GILK01009188.1~~GILK01009188.1.p1  ORF type:complete len:326 (-),score=31.44 GILK01009188.1:77-1009(-)